MARSVSEPRFPTPPQGSELTAREWPLWLAILRVAVPVPPATCLDGLTMRAELSGLRIEDLVRDKQVLVIEDQVAIRLRPPVLGLRSHEWSLLVPAALGAELTEPILSKRFRGVDRHGERWLVSGGWERCTDTLGVLLGEAVAADAQSLERLWKLSLSLWLEGAFLSELPAAPVKVLADQLGAQLLEASGKIKAITDVRLALFAAGQDATMAESAVRSLPLPGSRFADLLQVERFFGQVGTSPGEPYYSCLASAFARVAEPYALGNVLLKLDASAALLAALEVVVHNRPELIATYVWHPSFHAEGAFALLQLPQTLALPQAHQADLREEWLEAQRLGRELLLLGDRVIDWSSLVALGVNDESDAITRRHQGLAGYERDRAQYDAGTLWTEAISDEERAEQAVGVVEKYLRARVKRSDSATVFALQLHAALRDSLDVHPPRDNSRRRELAGKLATAIVDGYAAGLALDVEVSAVPRFLCAYGGLLARLVESLDRGGESWRKLMRPFDRDAYIAAARSGDAGSLDSQTINPVYGVPSIFRAHAETLVALGAALDVFAEPLQAALELYDTDRNVDLPAHAFSWSALARISGLRSGAACEPLFVTVGRLFGRDEQNPERLDAFLRDRHEVHILAYVAAGLGASHPFSEIIQPGLRALVNELLSSEEGVALGEALELASVLQEAGIPRDSERLARLALELAEHVGGRDPYTPVARSLLAGALAQQKLWAELLLFEKEGNAMVLSTHARFVANMQALALIELERFGEAKEVLKEILELDSADRVALVNRTALQLRARDWKGAIESAEAAKPLLRGDDLDLILLNEAHAREQLGDRFGAERVLVSLSGPAKTRPDVVAAREELRHGRRPRDLAPEVAVSGAGVQGELSKEQSAAAEKLRQPPDEGVDIAIVTALPQEYDAVLARLINLRDPPQAKGPFPNLFAWKLGEIPKADGTGAYKVVLAQAQRTGNLDTLYATMRTIDRWNPGQLVFSGIAGGMKRDELKQGDVVLSENIWHYDHGKIADKTYKPRNREFAPDAGLFMSAHNFGRNTEDWKRSGASPPRATHVPKCVPGLIGSGDKVIDDLRPAFVKAILKARHDLQAIEMEAAGAAVAIRNAQQEGRAVGFMMVRGISDVPDDGSDDSAAGTAERDDWKPYASTIAAHFIVSWIASSTWPFPPRS